MSFNERLNSDRYGMGFRTEDGKFKVPTIVWVILGVVGIVMIVMGATHKSGFSSMTDSSPPSYTGVPSVETSQPFNSNPYNTVDSYESASGIQSSIIQPPLSDGRQASIQNPSELLPRSDDKGQWSVSSPNGQGELMNINLLKAGFHSGINTIGSSNRNANLQLRSEPPNPQMYNGPWNNSTITQDAVRRPVLEIGQGPL